MKNSNSGGGILVLGAVIGGLVLLRFTLPSVFQTVKWIGIGALIVIAVLIVLVVVMASRVSNSEQKEKTVREGTLDQEQRQILFQGREALMRLRRSCLRIKNAGIRTKTNEVCALLDKILQTLKDKPDKLHSVRRVFRFYLPTLENVLQKYLTLESNQIKGDERPDQVLAFLEDCRVAMNKLYANLFADDILDMTVDMEAMRLAVKRDGLLDLTVPTQEEKKEKIHLTL